MLSAVFIWHEWINLNLNFTTVTLISIMLYIMFINWYELWQHVLAKISQLAHLAQNRTLPHVPKQTLNCIETIICKLVDGKYACPS